MDEHELHQSCLLTGTVVTEEEYQTHLALLLERLGKDHSPIMPCRCSTTCIRLAASPLREGREGIDESGVSRGVRPRHLFGASVASKSCIA